MEDYRWFIGIFEQQLIQDVEGDRDEKESCDSCKTEQPDWLCGENLIERTQEVSEQPHWGQVMFCGRSASCRLWYVVGR